MSLIKAINKYNSVSENVLKDLKIFS